MVDTPRPKTAMLTAFLKSALTGELPEIIKFMSSSGMGDSATALLYQTKLGYYALLEQQTPAGTTIRETIKKQFMTPKQIALKNELGIGKQGEVKEHTINFIERTFHILANDGVLKRKKINTYTYAFKFKKPWPENKPSPKKLEKAKKTNEMILKTAELIIPKSMRTLEKGEPYTKYEAKAYSLLWDNALKDPVLKAERQDLISILLKKLKNVWSKNKTLKIIDLGAGVGAGTIDWLEQLIQLGINAEFLLVDYAPNLLKLAETNVNNFLREKEEYINTQHLEYSFQYQKADITKKEDYLPHDIELEYYDVVFMSQILHYLPTNEDIKLVKTIEPYLKRRGILGLANAYSYSETYHIPPEFMLWNTENFRGFPYLSEIKYILKQAFPKVKEYRLGFVHLAYKK